MGKDEGPLMRVKQAAAYLCISPQTFRKLVKNGRIQVIPREHRHSPCLVERRELDAYIERVKREGYGKRS